MVLANWLAQIQKANTEDEVVSFACDQLARIRSGGRVAGSLEGNAILDADDIREIASHLARTPFAYNSPGHEADLDQQVLILFSLATDRLSQLEGRGAVQRSPSRSIPAR